MEEKKTPRFTRQELKDAVPIIQDGWTIQDACEWTAAFANNETLKRVYEIIADDALAISFQTMGQYRTALINRMRT